MVDNQFEVCFGWAFHGSLESIDTFVGSNVFVGDHLSEFTECVLVTWHSTESIESRHGDVSVDGILGASDEGASGVGWAFGVTDGFECDQDLFDTFMVILSFAFTESLLQEVFGLYDSTGSVL